MLHTSHLDTLHRREHSYSRELFHKMGVEVKSLSLFKSISCGSSSAVCEGKGVSAAPCRAGPCYEWRQLCSIFQDGLRNLVHPLPVCSYFLKSELYFLFEVVWL